MSVENGGALAVIERAQERGRYHARGCLRGLKERLLADLALDAHRFLVLGDGLGVSDASKPLGRGSREGAWKLTYGFGLRLSSLAALFLVALALLRGLGSLQRIISSPAS